MEHQRTAVAALLQQPNIEGEIQLPFSGGHEINVLTQGKVLGMGQNNVLSQGIESFLQKRCRGTLSDPGEVRRISDALLRRGFAWPDVKAGLNRLGAELYEE